MHKNSLNKEFDRFYDQISSKINLDDLNNLSNTKELIAKYKGFDNWYQLNKFYSIKDSQTKIFNDNQEIDIPFFVESIEKIIHSKNEIKTYPKKVQNYVIKDKTNIPALIGIDKDKKFLKNKKYYSLNSYPLYMEGSTGAGATEVSLSLAYQNIENDEGVIFIDHSGFSLYHKIYSFCEETNRLKDLYIFNCISHSLFENEENADLLTKNIKKRQQTNTIEPFNILISDKYIFSYLFGEKTTTWLYPYLYNLYVKNINLSLSSLLDLFSFHTLLKMKNNDLGNQQEVIAYLNHIGLTDEITDDDTLVSIMFDHFQYNAQAIEVIKIFLEYYNQNIFSDTPEIDFEDIFYNRKILTVFYPALEKSSEQWFLTANILNNAIYVAEKNTRKYNIHFQNIYSLDANYALFHLNDKDDLKNTKNKYVFKFQDFVSFEKGYKYIYKTNTITLESFQSFLIMKSYDYSILTKYLYFKYSDFNNFSQFNLATKDQYVGQGFFVDSINMNSFDYKKYIESTRNKKHLVINNNLNLTKTNPYSGDIIIKPIQCSYFSPKRANFIKIQNKGD